jgi:hypothetical protein
MIASSVGPEGVKGSVLVILLKPKDRIGNSELVKRCPITVATTGLPYGSQEDEHHEHEYVLHDEPCDVTEKAFVFSLFYETIRGVLAPQHVRKEAFTREEEQQLHKLQDFLRSQNPEIIDQIGDELSMLDRLINDHCSIPGGHP